MAQANAAGVLRTQADGRRSHMSDLLWAERVLALSLSAVCVPKSSVLSGGHDTDSQGTQSSEQTPQPGDMEEHTSTVRAAGCAVFFFVFFLASRNFIAKSYPPNLHLYYGGGFVAMLLNNVVTGRHWNFTRVRWLQITINNNKGRSGR